MSEEHPNDRWLRVTLGVAGISLAGYGVLRILQHPDASHPAALARWLAGGLILHDGFIAPIVVGVGWLLARLIPRRALGFVQAGLVTAALISAVAIVLMWRRGKTSSPSLALLRQNYTANLLALLAAVALLTALCYLGVLLRSKRTNSRPPADQ
jgi:hypothetical protein